MATSVGRAALDRALEEKDLLLVYQPIHDARTGEIWSVEALLRQRRQSGEIREASIITATAEEGPELFRLDSWAIRQAFADAAAWTIELNINLSPREFEETDVVARLLASGVTPQKVNLEITETSYIERPEETVKILSELTDAGFNLWLDDFGTKFSNLTHLLHFPVEGLKLNGTFTRNRGKRGTTITRRLIDLAHELGLKVIAEEVETEAQREFLLDCDCDYLQGFLLSKPMPAGDFGF
jgi:EAL domain-containing protein (putative c-di-GMP-specific phosphodiesterase class I)